jgi:hypothetical protein
MTPPFCNSVTEHAYLFILQDWLADADPAEVAGEWLEMATAEDATELLAATIRKDLYELYGGDENDALSVALARYALKRIAFQDVASRLLALARGVKAEDKPDGEPPAETA